MKINNNPTTLSERLIMEAEAERRANEKAATQVTSGELGVGKEDKQVSDKAEDLAASTDNTRISAQAMAKYRMLAGSKTAEERQERAPEEEGSFSRRAYQMGEEGRAAVWKRRIAQVSGREEEETEGAAEATSGRQMKSASGNDTFTSSLDDTEAAENGGSANQDDAAKEIRQRIKDVQARLTAAQQRLTQATAQANDAGESQHTRIAPLDSAASGAAVSKAGTGQAAAQTEVAAAESEVNALSGQLMKLYQELMQATKDSDK